MNVSLNGRIDDYSNSFGKILPSVKNSHGVALSEYVASLRPHYAVVYRDIAIGYLAIAVTMAFALTAEGWGGPLWLIAPLTALSIGFWIAYLQLFIHEGAHWNLASREASDRVCNRLISWWAGQEVSRYRRVHFQHHRALGTTADSENTYFSPLNLSFVVKGLLGIRVVEVLLGREALLKRQAMAQAPDKKESAGGQFIHKELIFGALFHATCVGALSWYGYWASAAGWVLGVGAVFPFFGALRQLLEHRSEDARADTDYRQADHGAVSRLFGDGLLGRTFGGAGFNRHLLHHWVPTVSYTRLADLEAFLMDTDLSEIIQARRTTYGRTFVAMMRHK